MNDLGKFFHDNVLNIHSDIQTSIDLMDRIYIDSSSLFLVSEGIKFEKCLKSLDFYLNIK